MERTSRTWLSNGVSLQAMHLLLLRFCVLGSVVGGGTFVVTRDLLSSSEISSPVRLGLGLLLGMPFQGVLASFLSVPVGFVPACVAGVAYWYLLNRFTSKNPNVAVRALLGATVGGIAALVFGGALFAKDIGPAGYSLAVNISSWLVAGIVGGAASALSARSRTSEALFYSRRQGSGV